MSADEHYDGRIYESDSYSYIIKPAIIIMALVLMISVFIMAFKTDDYVESLYGITDKELYVEIEERTSTICMIAFLVIIESLFLIVPIVDRTDAIVDFIFGILTLFASLIIFGIALSMYLKYKSAFDTIGRSLL